MSNNNHTICLLNDSFPPIIDGVANVMINYASIIEQNHGHSVVVTPNVPGCDDSIYDFPVVRYPSIDTRKLLGYVAGYPFSPEAANTVDKENVELLHTHCPVTSALLARQLAESCMLPLVMTWHTKYDIDVAKAIRSKILQEGALQAMLRNVNACDEVWTVSRGAGENLRSLGYEGDYIVMPNGVDLPRGRASAELIEKCTGKYDLPADVPCYLFIGRLMWYKGIRIILDALAELSQNNLDFRMVFVGDGTDGKEIRDYADNLGLKSNVHFTGALADRDALRAWYSRADLFLFPSTFDTNGLVVREAAAAGTASVIVEDSCAAEGISADRNGFFIGENAASLSSKLRELSENPEKVKLVGERASKEIYISWDDAVSRAYDRYQVVIDNYKSGKYKKHDPLRGSWMQSQGELMQILGDIGEAGKGLRSGLESIQERLEDTQSRIDMNMRSARNKALTEIITAGYETKESISAKAREALNTLERYL